jgi:predicted RNase H-like nuclease (RuvC/YqgF family)
LKSELLELHDRFQTIEKENFKLKSELITSEDLKKKSEANYRSLCENRGKVLRGLNTQTEIAKAQFQRDFEALKKQLETKDEIIQMQERKLKTLMDANCMLRNGLEQVQGPAFGGMETESEDDESLQNSIANGHNKHTTTTVQADLAKFIKQLDL